MLEESLSQKEIEAIGHLRNAWPPITARELQQLLGYKSSSSVYSMLKKLTKLGIIQRGVGGTIQLVRDPEEESQHGRTVNLPVVGSVPCGSPLLAEQNVEDWMQVSQEMARPPHRYFILRARGDSMNEAGIKDGDGVVVRQQPVANDGDRVVALIDDEATIKRFYRSTDGVALCPDSTNKEHKPILLTNDFRIQGMVVAVFPAKVFRELGQAP